MGEHPVRYRRAEDDGARGVGIRWTRRPATVADLEPIAELRASVLRADLERLGRYDAHRVRQRLRDGFLPGHTTVIEVNGEFAGCISLRPTSDAHWLEHFYIHAAYQSSGIGGAVLTELLELTDHAEVEVRLNVLQGSRAQRLYERHGFVVTAEDHIDVFMLRLAT